MKQSNYDLQWCFFFSLQNFAAVLWPTTHDTSKTTVEYFTTSLNINKLTFLSKCEIFHNFNNHPLTEVTANQQLLTIQHCSSKISKYWYKLNNNYVTLKEILYFSSFTFSQKTMVKCIGNYKHNIQFFFFLSTFGKLALSL